MIRSMLSVNNAATTTDIGILILRIGVGAFMLTHSYPRLLTLFSHETIEFRSVMGLSPVASLSLAVFAEFLCSLLVIVGLGTRLAVVPLIITMLVAAFYVHGADPFAKQEKALLFLTAYITLLFTGSGRFSLDAMITREKRTDR